MDLRAPDTEQGQALCKECGFCCDGTMFSRVPVGPDEPMATGFAARLQWDGERKFRQPCSVFVGVCSAYSSRPHVCTVFKCRLLRQCEVGKETWENAHAIVQRTRIHRDRVLAGLREAFGAAEQPLALTELLERFYEAKQPDESDAAFRKKHGALLLKEYGSLGHYLEKYFRPPLQKTVPILPLRNGERGDPVAADGTSELADDSSDLT